MHAHTYGKNSRRKAYKATAFILIAALLCTLTALYFAKVGAPLVAEIAEAEIRAQTVAAYVEANSNIHKLADFYGDFFEYEKNSEGEITLVRANTAGINSLVVHAQREVQASIDKITSGSIEIPAGAFTGISLIADKGGDISINVSPVGVVDVKINSFYYAEGINQTLHRLVMRITTTVHMLVPLKAQDVTVSMDFVLAEDILLGRVPDSYITGISQDNIFDLLP